jgi:hypothetical protein
MKPYQWWVFGFGALVMLIPGFSWAQHSHGHGSGAGSMKMDTREVLVEGIKVTFQVMANAEHRKMLKDMKMKDDIEPGTTHNITVVVKDEATQKEVTDASVGMKVVGPNGKDQVKNLKFESSMKSYDAYFNLPDKGKYDLLVLIKTGDEKKRTAGINYELK